jgi:hypothetical protein
LTGCGVLSDVSALDMKSPVTACLRSRWLANAKDPGKWPVSRSELELDGRRSARLNERPLNFPSRNVNYRKGGNVPLIGRDKGKALLFSFRRRPCIAKLTGLEPNRAMRRGKFHAKSANANNEQKVKKTRRATPAPLPRHLLAITAGHGHA